MDAITHATGLAGLVQPALVGVHEVRNVPTLATTLAQPHLLLLLLHVLLHLLRVLHELVVMLDSSHSSTGSRHRGCRGGVGSGQIAILGFALLLPAHAVALPTIRAGREKVLPISLLEERRLLPLAASAAPVAPVAPLVRWRKLPVLQMMLYLLQVLRWWRRRLRAHAHRIVLLGWRVVVRVLVVVVVTFARWRLRV